MNYLKKILSVIIALAGLNFVILVHEFGHFIFCKAFDVRTPVFSIGFGPEIVYKKIKSTKFQLAALPLGGYVSINEFDLEHVPYIQKMLIIFAGIFFNFILAFLILYYLYSKRNIDEEKEVYSKNKIIDFLIKSTPEDARELLEKSSKNRLIGPIGIISAMSQSVNLGFDVFIYFLATVSLNVGIFNLIPLSFLDGGQALLYTIQALFGRSTRAIFDNVGYLIFILAIIFIIFISIRDVFNLGRSK